VVNIASDQNPTKTADDDGMWFSAFRSCTFVGQRPSVHRSESNDAVARARRAKKPWNMCVKRVAG